MATTPPAGGPSDSPAPERVLATLDLRTLVLSLLLSPETGAFVVAALVFAGLFAALGQFAGVAAAVPVLIGFGLTLFRRLSAYYGFTVSETPAGLQVRRGLFERDAQTITLARVQGVVVSEPILWRRFGLGEARRRAGRLREQPGHGRAALGLDGDAGRPPAVRARAGPAPPRRGRLPGPRRRRAARPAGAVALGGAGATTLPRRGGRRAPGGEPGGGADAAYPRGPARPGAVAAARRRARGSGGSGWRTCWSTARPGPVRVRARHRDAGEARRLLDEENHRARLARASLRGLGPSDRVGRMAATTRPSRLTRTWPTVGAACWPWSCWP